MKETSISDNTKVITIDLRWFGLLAEHRGKRKETLRVPAEITGKELLDRFSKEIPILKKYRPYIRLAINQSYKKETEKIGDGDEVALITPVSGG